MFKLTQHTTLSLNHKELVRLLDILNAELDGERTNNIVVMASQYRNSWDAVFSRDIEWVFTWTDALKLRAYFTYYLAKEKKAAVNIPMTTLNKFPIYRNLPEVAQC